ncbi:hypothetical protein [Paraburkholderia sp. BR10954]|uniref:hypothetical protein n=1 Tax=Paraburkholderia sp. BR10954 TaxID=3236995 RepID=UPI0034D23F0F
MNTKAELIAQLPTWFVEHSKEEIEHATPEELAQHADSLRKVRDSIRGQVEDFWKKVLEYMAKNPEMAKEFNVLANKNWKESIERMNRESPGSGDWFGACIEEYATQLREEYDQNPAALKRKLGVREPARQTPTIEKTEHFEPALAAKQIKARDKRNYNFARLIWQAISYLF